VEQVKSGLKATSLGVYEVGVLASSPDWTNDKWPVPGVYAIEGLGIFFLVFEAKQAAMLAIISDVGDNRRYLAIGFFTV
jgi:hypothetical protein